MAWGFKSKLAVETAVEPVVSLKDLRRRWARDHLRNRIAVNSRDGSVMVYVPPGEFEMGDGQNNNCPKHPVALSGYWIGMYAVSNAQYARFVAATGHRASNKADYGDAVWNGGRFPPEKATHPVVCVSWDDATAYAEWAGCELASEAQWERAARGPLNRIYPWGDDWDQNRCRNDKNCGSEKTCAVHGYPDGVSGYGTYNQSGNVFEWCQDWYGGDYNGQSPRRDPRGPEGGSIRVCRGGSWRNDNPANFRGAHRFRLDPGCRLDNQGLRLVRSASRSLPS